MTTFDCLIAFKEQLTTSTILKIHQLLIEYDFTLEIASNSNYQLHDIETTETYPEATTITTQAIYKIAQHPTGGWIEYEFKKHGIVVNYQKMLEFPVNGSFVAIFIPIQLYKQKTQQFAVLLKVLTQSFTPLDIKLGEELIDQLDIEEYFHALSTNHSDLS